jgi:hypothetical protein
MTPREAFSECQYELPDWTTSGEAVDYRIVETPERIVLAFQASNSKADWTHNLQFAVVPYRWMEHKWRAHQGFVCAYKSVRDEVLAKIGYLLSQKDRPVTVTGWSHGAALAVLAYEDIAWHYPLARIFGHGFGTPRVLWGRLDLVHRYMTFERWNVRGDPVAMLPPWIMGYYHVGISHKLGPLSFINPESHTAKAIERYLP